jgi:hypothetical protein
MYAPLHRIPCTCLACTLRLKCGVPAANAVSPSPACTRTTACQALRSPPPRRLRAAALTPLLLSPATSTGSLSRARRWPPSAPPTRRWRTRARRRAAHVVQRRAERWLTCTFTGSRCCGRTCPATLTWHRQYQARTTTGNGVRVSFVPAHTSSVAGSTGKFGFTRSLPRNSTTIVWLHFSRPRSTARLEAAALAGHVLPVPGFVDKLIKKILAGDTDAVDLTGTGRALLSSNGSAPTAIKAQYFWFNFSNGSTWWHSSQVSNNPAIVYTQAADRCASAPRQRTLHSLCLSSCSAPLHHPSITRRRSPSARSSPSHRRHILCAAAVFAAASVVAACSNSLSQRHRAAAVTCALAYLLAFVATLLCPPVPVRPSSSMKSRAAAAADASHFMSLYVVFVFCCCTVAAAAAAQRQVVIKVPPAPNPPPPAAAASSCRCLLLLLPPPAAASSRAAALRLRVCGVERPWQLGARFSLTIVIQYHSSHLRTGIIISKLPHSALASRSASPRVFILTLAGAPLQAGAVILKRAAIRCSSLNQIKCQLRAVCWLTPPSVCVLMRWREWRGGPLLLLLEMRGAR